jgi:hypothetical protein
MNKESFVISAVVPAVDETLNANEVLLNVSVWTTRLLSKNARPRSTEMPAP